MPSDTAWFPLPINTRGARPAGSSAPPRPPRSRRSTASRPTGSNVFDDTSRSGKHRDPLPPPRRKDTSRTPQRTPPPDRHPAHPTTPKQPGGGNLECGGSTPLWLAGAVARGPPRVPSANPTPTADIVAPQLPPGGSSPPDKPKRRRAAALQISASLTGVGRLINGVARHRFGWQGRSRRASTRPLRQPPLRRQIS